MKDRSIQNFFCLLVCTVLLGVSCSPAGKYEVRRNLSTPADSSEASSTQYGENIRGELQLSSDTTESNPYLKVHMDNGDLYVLEESTLLKKERAVKGSGYQLNPSRKRVSRGKYYIGVDSVAIMETNKLTSSAAFTGMMIYTGASAVMSGLCLANPKACFGSCPTFYVQ